MSWQVFTGLMGGVGLFLLGMQLMTDGLKMSAGNALRSILKRSTKTALRGILSGVLITSLVQSSSAVTVAVIGFVNAGLLTLTQAIRVAYGSNLGTTMTGWLVAILGFGFHIQTAALPAIGVGVLLSLFSPSARWIGIGKAIAGFGLFFLGIDLLKTGFDGLEEMVSLSALEDQGMLSVLLFVGVGFLMTLIMQSSSAAIAITLTAAAGDVIGLHAAASMVIGANIGTTSTAVLAALAATSNAKRVAAGHVIFNLVTGCVALLMLPVLLWLVQWLQTSMGMVGGIATFLAIFHTLFNALGILLMWPFTNRMVAMLQKRFRAAEEDLAVPKFLDMTLMSTPSLAHDALTKEIGNIREISIRMAEDAINTEASISPQLSAEKEALDKLVDAVADFTKELQRSDLPLDIAQSLPEALATTRYFSAMSNKAIDIDERQSEKVSSINEDIDQMLIEYRRMAVSILEWMRTTEPLGQHDSEVNALERLQQLKARYENMKSRLLRAGTSGIMSVRHMLALIELLKEIERMVDDGVKGEGAFHLFTQAIKPLDDAMDNVKDVRSDSPVEELLSKP
ncbi:MAG: Na/Pi cotransporter family protein [Zetaproteobacteria bacterium]|nr:Na/Pi cotransporter family protein [Zetaproteobacteria bacterium]